MLFVQSLYVIIDVSGQPISPKLKVQEYLIIEAGTDKLYRNVCD